MPFRIATSAGVLLCAGTLMLSSPAKADHHDHAAHGSAGEGHERPLTSTAQGPSELSEASKELDEAMKRMHKGMSVPYTNDIDVDFVRGMIPHHQGAIEQAEILLKHSNNPRLRRLAGGIIATQRREIRFMEKWLRERGQGLTSEEMPDWLKNAPVAEGDQDESKKKD